MSRKPRWVNVYNLPGATGTICGVSRNSREKAIDGVSETRKLIVRLKVTPKPGYRWVLNAGYATLEEYP